jgi:hypothetical protein
MFSPISAAVITARTPVLARAAEASMPWMRPCATLLRRIIACSIPSRFKSSTNVPAPVRKRRSSARSTG